MISANNYVPINEMHQPSKQHHYGLVNWMSLGILANITSKHGGVLLYGATNCIVGPCNKHHERASAMRLSLSFSGSMYGKDPIIWIR